MSYRIAICDDEPFGCRCKKTNYGEIIIMKKLITIFLAVVICLSLVACGGNSTNGKNAVVGEWKSANGDTFFFNSDGTGARDDSDFQWTYNTESNLFTMHLMLDISFSIQEENGIKFIELLKTRYYHIDDYEKGFEIEKQAAIDTLNSYTEGRTKIEIGKSYDFSEGVTIAFLGATLIDYSNGHLCIDATFTGDNSVEKERLYGTYSFEYKTHYISDEVNTSWISSTIQWGANIGEYGGAEELEPGATVQTRGSVFSLYNTSVDKLSTVICCFEMNGIEYYIDLSDYLK